MKQVRETPSNRLSLTHRFALVGIAVVALALLLVAYNLEPDPRGFGTHEQLGLTPCLFQKYTGHQCPTCGATTAWAYAIRGQLTQAAAVNLAGMILCLAAMICVPWLLITASVGRWIVCRLKLRVILIVATAWIMLMLCDWFVTLIRNSTYNIN